MSNPLLYRLSLASILFLITMLSISFTIYTLYQQALSEARLTLTVAAKGQARLMDSIVRFERRQLGSGQEKEAVAATLKQIREAYREYHAFAETGEMVVAKRQGDRIRFLLWHGIDDPAQPPAPLIAWDSVDGEPMRRALLGRSGMMMALDYRGRQVVAAYEPTTELGYGVVFKIDLDEVQAPFIRAVLISFAGALLLFAIGTWLFGRLTHPLIERTIANERFNSLLLHSAAEGIYGLDRKGCCTFANEASCQLLGYEQKELLGRNLHDLLHHSRADGSPYPEEECPSRLAMQSGKVIHTDDEVLWRRDGTPMPVDYHVHPIREKGHVTGAVVSVVDVTDRKHAETKLRESEELLRSTFNHAAVGIARVSPDGTLLRVNRRFCDILGYAKRSEVQGKSIAEVSHPDDVENSLATVRSLLNGERETASMEKRYLRKDGSVIWGDVTISLVRSKPDGKPKFFIAVLQDVQLRKEAQANLEKSEARLSEAQQVAQIGSWELDLVNNRLLWSDEVYDIFEIDREKFGASYEAFLNAIHPEDREMVNKAYTDSVETHGYYEIMHRLQMPDGRIKHVQERGQSFYDEQGKPLRSIGTVQDLTRLHDMEEQLQQAQKMEALGTLVGGIAHDFNNKLAAITGNLFLAQGRVKDNPEAIGHLKVVEQLGFEAADIIAQLLAFARKGRLNKVALLLVPFLKEASKLNRVAIPANIKYSLDYGNDLLPVMGDVTQLQQVFLNLINNARDAVAGVESPRIDVDLRAVEPDRSFFERHPKLKQDVGYACLSVSDNGCGIAEAKLPHIFEPFFTTKDVGKGTGLGLAMAYGVVQNHNGAIEVESEIGKGTVFSVYLPLDPKAAGSAAMKQADDVVDGKGETILLADDEWSVLDTFSEVLTSLNYKVLPARDGLEAVELYREHAQEIDLVILDIVLPELMGWEAAAEIRKINPEVKLLYCSGYDTLREQPESVRDAKVLEKPYVLESVSRTIRQTLEG